MFLEIAFIKSFLPEIMLSFFILIQLLFNIKIVNKFKSNLGIIELNNISILFLLLCLFFLYINTSSDGLFSNFSLSNNDATILCKTFLILISFLTMIVIGRANIIEKINFFEYYSIFLLALFSLLLMLSCENLVSFYLVMEMQSLCFYLLAAFNRNSIFSVEAGLKYFISGSFISGFYLLGCSLVYGTLGTLDFHGFAVLLSFPIAQFSILNNLTIIGLLLIVFSLLFKLACAPFHFWSPDVYDGSPLSSITIFSIIPKLSLFYFFVKLLLAVSIFENISQYLLVSGLLSTFIGTFYALKQKRLKRLIIYSSIAQTGFLVASISVSTFDSLASMYFFLFIYLLTSLLIWGHLINFNGSNMQISRFLKQQTEAIYLSSFSNLLKISSIFSVSILIFFFSVAGVPPLVGFLAKMLVLLQLINSKNMLAASFLIIISAVSVYYYIRLIKVIYFESNYSIKTSPMQILFSGTFVEDIMYVILLVSLIYLFFLPNQLLLVCQILIMGIGII